MIFGCAGLSLTLQNLLHGSLESPGWLEDVREIGIGFQNGGWPLGWYPSCLTPEKELFKRVIYLGCGPLPGFQSQMKVFRDSPTKNGMSTWWSLASWDPRATPKIYPANDERNWLLPTTLKPWASSSSSSPSRRKSASLTFIYIYIHMRGFMKTVAGENSPHFFCTS